MLKETEATRIPLDLTAKLKVPPHSVDAEQAVLGGLMLDNKAWDQIADKLVEKHFYRRDHQLIFRAMVKLMSENKPLDVITVSEVLQQLEMHDEVGGLAYLGELAKNTPSAANIGAYAEIVYERAILRELISVGTLITESAFDPQGRASLEILDEAEKKVFDISEQGSRGSGPEGIRGIVSKAIDNIEKRFHDNNPVTGIATGFADFDRLTTGMQEGDLVIVAGRPSMGKTLLGMNIAEHAAIRSQKAVLVFSMEMPGESLAMRMLSSIGRIDQNKLRTGRLVEEDWTRLTSAVSLLSNAKLYIDETPALTPMEMRTRARRVARERDGLGLIVVDYLQLMRGSSTTDNRTAEISEISRSLKQLAKELRVPVVALSQLNRSLEQRPNKRPVMSDLRESGAIEQDADLIVFIYRDEVYNEDSPDKGTAEIIIGKQRNGPIGTVRLTFMGQYARFENFTTDNMMAAIEA
ncbi:replicative DNA helicase [Candidatus Berkiella aquae]|uniref:Replicative DNA helicase n=1 Tax=Candidatus Berkiella aquae TaxID=295108 RepID=A0A0Q9YIV3_9GAMM|nr:replicative DNA helicase [Candidatus Berkiella aquae]